MTRIRTHLLIHTRIRIPTKNHTARTALRDASFVMAILLHRPSKLGMEFCNKEKRTPAKLLHLVFFCPNLIAKILQRQSLNLKTKSMEYGFAGVAKRHICDFCTFLIFIYQKVQNCYFKCTSSFFFA